MAPAVAAGLRPAKQTGGTADAPRLRRLGRRHHGHRRALFAFFDAGPTGEPNAGIRYLRAHAGQRVTLSLRHADGTTQDVNVLLNSSEVATVGAARQRRDRPGRAGHRGLLVPAGTHDRARPARRHQPGGAAHGHGGGHGHDCGGRPARQPEQPAGRRPDRHRRHRRPGPHAEPADLPGLPDRPAVGQPGRHQRRCPSRPWMAVGSSSASSSASWGRASARRAEAATYLVGFGLLIAFILWISYFDITRPGGG